MSPLWMNLNERKNRPSPRPKCDETKYAQKISIKGMWLFISRWMEGSMTVEASVVLPLFLMFFLALGSAMEMIRLHANLEFALWDIGNRMSVYGHALTGSEENLIWSEAGDIALTYTYVKKEIENYLGTEYLDASPLVGGAEGLRFVESEIWDGGEDFEILVTYQVAPFGEIAGVKGFRMANRYYGHFWNGYRIPIEVFYTAENGEVYHKDAMCSHLFLSVTQVILPEAYTARNQKGEKYTPCELCEKTESGNWVYITEEGNRIHYQRYCSGLKRTVFEVSAEEAAGYRPCSRCVESE